MAPIPRWLITCALLALLSLLGTWHGEAGRPPWETVIIFSGLATTLPIALVAPLGLAGRAGLTLLSLALFAATFAHGSHSFDRAFSDCLARGETIRVQLDRYHARHQVYPASLEALDMALPCDRLIRPTLLDYALTADGYRISFRDWLVEHVATESEPFTAFK